MITDEMVEVAMRSWNGMHVGTANDRMKAALEALEAAGYRVLKVASTEQVQAAEKRFTPEQQERFFRDFPFYEEDEVPPPTTGGGGTDIR